VRRALLIAGLTLVAAGCGGGGKGAATTAPATTAPATTAPPVTTTSGDPGRDAIEAFAAAARSRNAAALWHLLSTSSRQRLGPTLDDFRRGGAPGLERTVGAFHDFTVLVSERITPEFGVVAIDGREGAKRAVYAVPLRLEGTSWKVELGSLVAVRPIGPLPDSGAQVAVQIAFAVTGPGGSGTSVLYLDGHAESNLKVYGTATSSTVVANFDPALDPGRHTAVAFATDGREAAATAWAFTAAKP
jgi:prepilin-type processing-associated H-X9-DG protein